jgi:predicted transcriptional regulator
MKHKYRNRTEIISQILQSIGEQGTGITRIIFTAMLSFSQAKEYLSQLDRLGMIRFDSDRKLYFRTSKAEQFLRIYGTLKRQLGEQDT